MNLVETVAAGVSPWPILSLVSGLIAFFVTVVALKDPDLNR